MKLYHILGSVLLTLFCVSLSWAAKAKQQRCNFKFTVDTANTQAFCHETLKDQNVSKMSGGNQNEDKILDTISQALSTHQMAAQTQELLRELNVSLSHQGALYGSLVAKVTALEKQLRQISQTEDESDSGIPWYFSGCPANSLLRWHTLAPIKSVDTLKIIEIVPQSCWEWYHHKGHRSTGRYRIDPDGLDGQPPFEVDCVMSGDGPITVLHHDSEARTRVKGYEDPGSYVREVDYGVSADQLELLVTLSSSCAQLLSWECRGAALLDHSWWVDRRGTAADHWAGGAGQHFCGCGVNASCLAGMACNCNINNDHQWTSDEGVITDRDLLPVTRLHLGDTGGTEEEGYHTLGPLNCVHNVVSTYPSDVNALLPAQTWSPFQAYCDPEGWMVIMRRHLSPSGLQTSSFNRSHSEYTYGFHDGSDFWLGLDKIYQLTNQGMADHSLQIVFTTHDEIKHYAQHSVFSVSNGNDGHKINFRRKSYTGTLPDNLSESFGEAFVYTVQAGYGSGWWYTSNSKEDTLTGSKVKWGDLDVNLYSMLELRIKGQPNNKRG